MITVLFLHSGVNYLHAFSLKLQTLMDLANVSHTHKSSCVKQDTKITSVSQKWNASCAV